MPKGPLISVLVTVHNREQYLEECLTSILGSTQEDFEVVVVDDVSTDGSVEIARSFAERDRRVQLHINESNLGDYPNRNRAAQLASGKYLKYVDSDDLIAPDCLARLCEPLEADSRAAYSLSYPRPSDLRRPALLSPREAYEIHFVKHQGIFSAGPLLAMVRADRFREVGGFRDRARNMGDTLLWLEFCSRWPMFLVEDGLTHWRQHEGQEYGLVRDVGLQNAVTHCMLTSAILEEFLEQDTCPLSASARSRARTRLRRRNAERVLWHLRHGRFRLAGFEARWFAQDVLGGRPHSIERGGVVSARETSK